MDLLQILLLLLLLIGLANLFLTLKNQNKHKDSELQQKLQGLSDEIARNLERVEKGFKDEFQRNREEYQHTAQTGRIELARNLHEFGQTNTQNNRDLNELIRQKFGDFGLQQESLNAKSLELLKNLREGIEKQLIFIREDNSRQLTEMRKTVDEKLQKTINDRLSQSFETVRKQLFDVQQGLGEMKNIANDVGGLKRVLSSVKLRGSLGEIQLSLLLEQILAPQQYQANVKPRPQGSDFVEFAIKLPGKDPTIPNIWLPIDAKFPKDIYERVQNAYEGGEAEEIAAAQKELALTIKKMAKDIHDKYLEPPYTTNFGIMFLPFEGIYGEVVKNAQLLEDLQREFQVIVTGPTTLAAILNSLQIGFRTLAIQERSNEVWAVLSEVKTEFEKFGGLLQKAQKNIQTGLNQLDEIGGTRTRMLQNKLEKVSRLSKADEKVVVPEIEQNNSKE